MKFKLTRLNRLMKPQDDDGADEGTGEAVGTGNDARVAMLERINDANDELRADELRNVNDDDTTEEFQAQHLTPSDDDGVTQAELDRMAAEANPAPAQQTQQQPRMITRKVNGRDLTLTEDQWFDRAAKVEAADQYLSEAARMRREAEQLHAQNQTQTPSQRDVSASDAESRRALVRAIQMGTEDEAMAALEQLQTPQGQQYSQEDLLRAVDARLTFKEALGKFQTEFSDIVSDPVLASLAAEKDKQLLAAGDRRSYYERFASVGNEVRAWRDNLVRSATPAVDPLQAKAAAKADAATRSVPRASSNKAKPANIDDDQQESASDIIANIAKARGGPQWSRA